MTFNQFKNRIYASADCGVISVHTATSLIAQLEENDPNGYIVKEEPIFAVEVGDSYLSDQSLEKVGYFKGFGRAYKALKDYLKADPSNRYPYNTYSGKPQRLSEVIHPSQQWGFIGGKNEFQGYIKWCSDAIDSNADRDYAMFRIYAIDVE